MRLTHPTSVALLATLALAGPAAADQTTPNPGPSAGTTRLAEYAGHGISQLNGTAVWSQQEADGYHLMRSEQGAAPTEVPVAPQPFPFDIDLGTATDGVTTAAVVSICQAAGNGPKKGTCDVHTLNLDTGAQREVPAASEPGLDEVAPTIWRGTIVFGREGQGKASIRLVGKKGKLKTLSLGGSRQPFSYVSSTDLDDGGLAVSGTARESASEGPGTEQIFYKRADHTARLIGSWGYGEEHAPNFSVSISGPKVWIGAANQADTGNDASSVVTWDRATHQFVGESFGPILDSVAADAKNPAAPVLFSTERGYDTQSAGQVARIDAFSPGPLSGELARVFRKR